MSPLIAFWTRRARRAHLPAVHCVRVSVLTTCSLARPRPRTVNRGRRPPARRPRCSETARAGPAHRGPASSRGCRPRQRQLRRGPEQAGQPVRLSPACRREERPWQKDQGCHPSPGVLDSVGRDGAPSRRTLRRHALSIRAGKDSRVTPGQSSTKRVIVCPEPPTRPRRPKRRRRARAARGRLRAHPSGLRSHVSLAT